MNDIQADGQISAALKFGDEFLSVGNFSTDGNAVPDIFHAVRHRHGDYLHRSSGASGLSDGQLHIGGLSPGDLVHFRNGLSQPSRLNTVNDELTEQNQDRADTNPNRDVTTNRLILAISLYLCGFVWSLRGWEYFDDKRRFVGAARIGCGFGLCALALFILVGAIDLWGWL